MHRIASFNWKFKCYANKTVRIAQFGVLYWFFIVESNILVYCASERNWLPTYIWHHYEYYILLCNNTYNGIIISIFHNSDVVENYSIEPRFWIKNHFNRGFQQMFSLFLLVRGLFSVEIFFNSSKLPWDFSQFFASVVYKKVWGSYSKHSYGLAYLL